MEEEKHESHPVHHAHHRKKSSVTKIVRDNPWIISSIVLGILVLIMVFSGFSGGTGKVISESKIGSKAVDFVNLELLQGQGSVTLVSVSQEEGFYKVIVDYSGQEVPIYFTKDGYYMGSVLASVGSIEDAPSSTESVDQNIPKSGKPSVELFVMSYCPYGTQAEKGLLPVLNLLGDKIDFHLRFVYYAMHPSYGEVEENLRQYCIQKEQENVFNDYLECFLEEGDSPSCLVETGVDQDALESCFIVADEEFSVSANKDDTSSWLSGKYPLFDVDKELNEKYGVGGSPTLVINGVKVSSGRSPAAMLDAVCQSFTEGSAPEVCDTELPSDSYSPGFGWTLSTGQSTEGAQCY